MYNLTNLTTQENRGFENRDQLLAFLDQQNAICQTDGQQLTLKLNHVDHDSGEILDNMTISLPLERDVDSLLLNFGKAEKKKLPIPSFGKRPRDRPKPVAQEPAEQEEPKLSKKEKVRPAPKPRQLKQPARFRKGLTSLALVISLASAAISLYQHSHIQTLSRQVNQLQAERLPANLDHQLNVFGRYFLASYYGQQTSDLSSFVSPDLLPDVKHQEAQLTSAIMEAVAKDKNRYQASFILTLKEGETIRTSRLVLDLEQTEGSPYGFLVVNSPQEKPFPKK